MIYEGIMINESEFAAYVVVINYDAKCPARAFTEKIIDPNKKMSAEDHLDIRNFIGKSGKCCLESCITTALYETMLGIQTNIPKKCDN